MLVHKFLSLEYAIDDLVKHRLKIAEYHDMNDPFELRGAWASNPLYQQIMLDVIKKGGVLCFSKVDSDPILWSHYAEKHRGCCIGFEVDPSVNLEPTIPVDVPRAVPLNMLRLEAFFRDADRSGRSPISESDPEFLKLTGSRELDEITKAVLFSKYSGWNYEQEVRLLIALKPDQKDGTLYFADLDDTFKPVEVLLGARCTEEDEEKLRYAVNRYDPPLPIIRTALSTDSFKIVRSCEGA
jgi:hypothetical protein